MKPIPRHWTKRMTFKDPSLKPINPKDRIKYWNIVPGDRIGLLGDRFKTIHEVLSINKLTNRVYLKGAQNEGEGAVRAPRSTSVPYAKCRLWMGNINLRISNGELKPTDVFATRVSTSKPYWDPIKHRWVWKRFAVNTVPRLPKEETGADRSEIPWPEPEKLSIPEATFYDTPAHIVSEVTYKPPQLIRPGPGGSLIPMRPAREQTYINTLWNGLEFNDGMLPELHMQAELSNPHSRAKKQARWQAKQERERDLLKKLIKAEGDNRRGRSSGELRKVAVFKWKLQLQEEKRAEKRRRWINRGMVERVQARKERKAKKAAKTSERLLNLVLEEAANQVIPPTTTT